MRTKGFGAVAVALAAALSAAPVRAQAPASEADREYAFASWLVQQGFPDFAERLLDQLARRFPDQADRGKIVQAESLIARRRFADAEALVAAMPADSPRTHAVRLAIANGYFRIGEAQRARAIYDAFFQQYKGAVPTDPDFRRFYLDAAYRLGQMLETAGDLAGAAAAYERALDAKPEDNIARRLSAELAALQVRAAAQKTGAEREELLRKAKKLCEEVQWKGVDLWFGQTVITLANIELLRGNRDAAAKTIRDYMDILRQIDEQLKKEEIPLALSPMAGARHLLGDIYRELGEAKITAGDQAEGVKLLTDALREYVNVFARYAESDWALPAGERAEQLKARIEGLIGRPIEINYGPHLRNVVQAQFRLADNHFIQRRFADAVRQYLSILNRFPDFEGVGRPLTNLIVCYAQEKDDWSMRAVAEHIVERYARDAEAANGLLAAAKVYFDREQAEQYLYLYNLFVDRYPKHERTPMVLFSLAGIVRRAGNEAAADAYLERIIKNFPNDQYYPRALNQLAWSHYRAQRFDEAIRLFEQLIRDTPPSHERAMAQFSLADALVRVNNFDRAIKEFETLQQWLGPTQNNPYGTTSAEIAKNQELLRNATFYLGYSLSRIPAPPDQLAGVRAAAVRMLEDFVKQFGETELAPKALSIIGSIHLELGDSARASAAFEELARRYPRSEEGRSAHFARISAAVELGRLDTAREAWGEVRQAPDKFSLDQIVRMGDLLRGAGLHAEAAEAYEIVRRNEMADRVQLEPALFGLGTSLYELKRYPECVSALQELITKFPRSALFYQAQFLLGRAFREMDRPADAEAALSEVFRFATDPVLIATANLELAEIQLRQARRLAAENRVKESREQIQAALASYFRIVNSSDPKNAKVRSMVEQALLASVPLYMEIGDFNAAVEECEQYLTLFPDGSHAATFRRWREEARLRAATATP